MKVVSAQSLLIYSTLSLISALPRYSTNSEAPDRYCQGLIVRINTLGANIDAKVCVGRTGHNYNYDDIDKMSCSGLIVAVEALGINVKAGLCSGNGNGRHESGYKQGDVEDYNDSSEGEGGDYNEDHPGNGN
ncbi:hypothetical protein K7432_018435, partial [Basidiobolus ranarum]